MQGGQTTLGSTQPRHFVILNQSPIVPSQMILSPKFAPACNSIRKILLTGDLRQVYFAAARHRASSCAQYLLDLAAYFISYLFYSIKRLLFQHCNPSRRSSVHSLAISPTLRLANSSDRGGDPIQMFNVRNCVLNGKICKTESDGRY